MMRNRLIVKSLVAGIVCVAPNALAASKVSAGGEHWVAIGQASHWLLLETSTRRTERVVSPMVAEDLTVSSDGRLIAFTSANATNSGLFVWDRKSAKAPTSVGESFGYHADPVFSADGATLYFAHNRSGAGRPNAHQQRAYAQIYRVQVDGSQLQQLTNEDGCHFAPRVVGDQLLFVHTMCHRKSRWVEAMDVRSGRSLGRVVQESALPLDEVAASRDGQRLAFSICGNDSMAIAEYDKRRKTLRTLFEYPRDGTRGRPQYGDANEVFFLREGAAWVFDGHSLNLLTRVEER